MNSCADAHAPGWVKQLGYSLCDDVEPPAFGSFTAVCDITSMQAEASGTWPVIRVGMHLVRVSEEELVEAVTRQPMKLEQVLGWRARAAVAEVTPGSPVPAPQLS